MTIKAIQTVYKGYKFRSRLEARWAIFFDALGLDWEYEPEGYELPDGTYYLPDFYLPSMRIWVEVKPRKLNAEEQKKAFLLSSSTGDVVIHLSQIPDPSELYGWLSITSVDFYYGIDMPGIHKEWFALDLIEFYLSENRMGNLPTSDDLYKKAHAWDRDYYTKKNGTSHPWNLEHGRLMSRELFNGLDCSFAASKARQARFEHGETPQ